MLHKLDRAWRHPYIQQGFTVAFALALLALPVTSNPWLADLGGASMVAPLSIPFFYGVAIFWALPHILRGSPLPLEVKPFSLFLIVAAISWAFSLFLPIPAYKEHLITSEAAKAFLTLSIAAVVYTVCAAWISQKPERLKFAVRWVSVGGLILILWSLAQSYVVLFMDGDYPNLFYRLQDMISARHGKLLFEDRVTGMAFEPSWLAHQLVLVFLPLWLSCTITGFSTFRKLGIFSLENLLLVLGVVVLFLAFSRIGWISFVLILAYLGLQFVLYLSKKTQGHFLPDWGGKWPGLKKALITVAFFSVLLISLAGVVALFLFLGARLDERIARILTYDLANADNFLYLTNLLLFAERVVYWIAGWEVFNQFPWLGVGIGNAGFFFPQTMPNFGFGLTEIRDLFFRITTVPNTKSLWVRLFAETGVLGVASFTTWLFILLKSTSLIKRFGSAEAQIISWMGQFTIVAFLAEGFSLDSFAMPYFWFSMGLVTAAAAITRKEIRAQNPGFFV